jgi:hypothetical protein
MRSKLRFQQLFQAEYSHVATFSKIPPVYGGFANTVGKPQFTDGYIAQGGVTDKQMNKTIFDKDFIFFSNRRSYKETNSMRK